MYFFNAVKIGGVNVQRFNLATLIHVDKNEDLSNTGGGRKSKSYNKRYSKNKNRSHINNNNKYRKTRRNQSRNKKEKHHNKRRTKHNKKYHK